MNTALGPSDVKCMGSGPCWVYQGSDGRAGEEAGHASVLEGPATALECSHNTWKRESVVSGT